MPPDSRLAHREMVHQLVPGHAFTPTVLGERTQYPLPILLFSKRRRVHLRRHLVPRGLSLGLHLNFPLLTAEVLGHHALIDIDRVAAVEAGTAARGDPEAMPPRNRKRPAAFPV